MEADYTTREALIKWLEDFSQAVVSRDFKATLELFSASAEVSHWPSESGLQVGRAEVEEFFKSLYGQPFTISWAWRPLVFAVTGDAAWLATDSDEIYTVGSQEKRYPYRVTAIFEKDAGGWKCVHFHGSEPAQHEAETAHSE